MEQIKPTPTLHLMVGLPCSGKTTRAKALEREHNALRFTPDEWQIVLFGDDMLSEGHDADHERVEKLMWQVAARALALGVDVILDFGFWARAEREDFRARAAALGVNFRIHYMDVPTEELYRRMALRNAAPGPDSYAIPAAEMDRYVGWFEPPGADELDQGAVFGAPQGGREGAAESGRNR